MGVPFKRFRHGHRPVENYCRFRHLFHSCASLSGAAFYFSIFCTIHDSLGLRTEQLPLNKEYEMLIGWSELYELAAIETKKMIVNALIRRIDVYRGYRVHIDFNIDFDQFRYGLDLRGKTISFEDISA